MYTRFPTFSHDEVEPKTICKAFSSLDNEKKILVIDEKMEFMRKIIIYS